MKLFLYIWLFMCEKDLYDNTNNSGVQSLLFDTTLQKCQNITTLAVTSNMNDWRPQGHLGKTHTFHLSNFLCRSAPPREGSAVWPCVDEVENEPFAATHSVKLYHPKNCHLSLSFSPVLSIACCS